MFRRQALISLFCLTGAFRAHAGQFDVPLPENCARRLIPLVTKVLGTREDNLEDSQIYIFSLTELGKAGVTLRATRERVPFHQLAARIFTSPTREQKEELKARLRWRGELERVRARNVRILHLTFRETSKEFAKHDWIDPKTSDLPVQDAFAQDFATRERLARAAVSAFGRYFNVIEFAWTGDSLNWHDLEDAAVAGVAQNQKRQPIAGQTWLAHYLAKRGWTEEWLIDVHYPEDHNHVALPVGYRQNAIAQQNLKATSLFFRAP